MDTNENSNNKTNKLTIINTIAIVILVIIFGYFAITYYTNNNSNDNKENNTARNISYSYISYIDFANDNKNHYNENLLLYDDNTFEYIIAEENGKKTTLATGTYALSNSKITLNIDSNSTIKKTSCDFMIKADRITSDCMTTDEDKENNPADGNIILFNEKGNDPVRLRASYTIYLYSLVGKTGDNGKYNDFKKINIDSIYGCYGDVDKFICKVTNTMTFDKKIKEDDEWLIPTGSIINDNTISRDRYIPFEDDGQGDFNVIGEYTSY